MTILKHMKLHFPPPLTKESCQMSWTDWLSASLQCY